MTKRKDFSPTELRVLEAITTGEQNKEVAQKLGMAEATIKVHMKSIMRKTGSHNRTQVAIWNTRRLQIVVIRRAHTALQEDRITDARHILAAELKESGVTA